MSDQPNPPGQQSGQQNDPPTWLKGLEALITKQGGSDGAAMLLYQENHAHRQRIKELEAQLPQGAVVLTGDNAAAWDAYQKRGTPSDIEAAFKERDDAKGELSKVARERSIARAAEAHGLKASVLAKLPGLDGEITVKDVTAADGTVGKQAVLKTDQGEKPLLDVLSADYADFLPALQANAQQQPPRGTAWPAQSGANGQPRTQEQAIEQSRKSLEQSGKYGGF